MARHDVKLLIMSEFKRVGGSSSSRTGYWGTYLYLNHPPELGIHGWNQK
jgi:hypothetical protein